MNPSTRTALALAATTFALSACYVLPIGPDGQPVYPVAPVAVPAPAPYSMAPMPMVLQARLYPVNDIAAQTGMLSGSITATPGSKGRFQLNYHGDTLIGEATRVSNDERRGVASAYSQDGLSMSCEYQMLNTRQGAGTCSFSNGAKYQVHIGI